MDLNVHKELLRRQFAAQAKVHPKTAKLRRQENVVPMIELARPKASDRMLDLACGWGFVVAAFAPHVRSVVGVDLTPEQVDLARRSTSFKNVEFQVGDAEDLRFGTGDFDLVTCRFTFHHFAQPEKVLREMKRVLAPGGRIVLYDYLASADAKKAARHNEIELARDPSHIRIYSYKEFSAFFRTCGLVEQGRITTLMKRHFDHWMSFVDADAATCRKVKKLMEDSIEGNRAGLGIRIRNGELSFTHTCEAWLLTPKES